MNGINLVATRPDLLDRGIILTLEAIPENERRPEEELWNDFEKMRPRVLGAMFSAMSGALSTREKVDLRSLPRLADFGAWGTAIAGELGYSTPDFMDAYAANVAAQNESALDESIVAQAVTKFIGEVKEWEGQASLLLKEIEERAEEMGFNTKAKQWPKAANVLSRRLREIAPNLRRIQIQIAEKKSGGVKLWRLALQDREKTDPTDPIDPSEPENPQDKEENRPPGQEIPTLKETLSTPAKASVRYGGDDGVDRVDVFGTSTGSRETVADLGDDEGEI